MSLTYIKRYRMEIDLTRPLYPPPPLPAGYAARPWHDSLLEVHAETKLRCFRCELDAHVFPSLGHIDGCLRLMRDITAGDCFVEGATWLIEYRAQAGAAPEFCGTIQGVRCRPGLGAVQNVGMVPAHRGRGLGSHLVYRSLRGFQEAGVPRVSLEVTANNTGAIRLYRRLGFHAPAPYTRQWPLRARSRIVTLVG